MPELAQRCVESWHRFMPDFEYRLWNEKNFDICSSAYAKEAYLAGRFAFVSDVVRLKALKVEGGIYLDVDFLVYKSFESLLHFNAFAGFEGSKYNPVMMGVIASEANGMWVSEQLDAYQGRHFIVDGKEDLTTNVKFISDRMRKQGFVPNGVEQEYKDLHIFPVDYFCPRLTTGEYRKNENTFCESIGTASSWATKSWKSQLLSRLDPGMRTRLILLKRKIFG